MIEQIDLANREEALAVLGLAFRDHPMMPTDPRGRRARVMIKTLVGAFAAAPDAHLFGLRRDGQLACAAFVHAYGYEPTVLWMGRMLFRMLWGFGPRHSLRLMRVMSQKREGDERRLELLLLGTRAEHQAQGLGRAMLRHVFAFAEAGGYDSVVLEVAKRTPAFGFYQSEGFGVDKEIELPVMPLCMMTRRLGGGEVAGE